MYRRVQTSLWEDNWFTDFGPEQKLLYLYFVTGPTQRKCGAFEVNWRRASFDTGIPIDALAHLVAGMAPYVRHDIKSGLIAVAGFMEHQDCGEKWRIGAGKQAGELPPELGAYVRKPLKAFESLSKPIEAYPSEAVTETGAVTDAVTETDLSSPNGDSPTSGAGRPNSIPNCPHKQLIDLYHEILPECPRVRVWKSRTRLNYSGGRWADMWRMIKDEEGKPPNADRLLQAFRTFFDWIRESEFLMGRSSDFLTDLEWLLKPNNWEKILNNRYHTGTRKQRLWAALMDDFDDDGGEDL